MRSFNKCHEILILSNLTGEDFALFKELSRMMITGDTKRSGDWQQWAVNNIEKCEQRARK